MVTITEVPASYTANTERALVPARSQTKAHAGHVGVQADRMSSEDKTKDYAHNLKLNIMTGSMPVFAESQMVDHHISMHAKNIFKGGFYDQPLVVGGYARDFSILPALLFMQALNPVHAGAQYVHMPFPEHTMGAAFTDDSPKVTAQHAQAHERAAHSIGVFLALLFLNGLQKMRSYMQANAEPEERIFRREETTPRAATTAAEPEETVFKEEEAVDTTATAARASVVSEPETDDSNPKRSVYKGGKVVIEELS
jgi:ribosomal protein S19